MMDKKISDELMYAVGVGRLDEVRELINKYDLHNLTTWSEGYITLRMALQWKYTKIAKLLLSLGCPVNSKDKKKPRNTPFHIAVENGDMEIVQMFLDKGANIDATVYNDKTVLHVAVDGENLKIVELLLKHGADVDPTINLGPRRGYTPLCIAVKNGNEEIIKLLLSNGADIFTTTDEGVSPLHFAVATGDLTILEHLLKNVANDNSGYTSQCINGYTPLHRAVEKGSEEIVKLLLSKGAKVDSKGSNGMTPLHIAAEQGCLQIAKVLLKEGAYVDSVYGIINCGGYTPLRIAVWNRHEKVVKLLLENGANIDSELVNALIVKHHFTYGRPDINHQGNRKDKEIVDIFLQFGFIVEPKSYYDYHKILCGAVRNGHFQIVVQLLNKWEEIAKLSKTHVAETNATDENESISTVYTTNPTQKLKPELLGIAAKTEHKEIVELLLQHGADINAIDKCGRTALHFTSINEDQWQCNIINTDVKRDIAKLLLRWGADVNARVVNSFTTLHIAVENEYVEVVEALLEHNADVNSVSKCGITPLHICAETGNKVISKMLLNKGAIVNAKQGNGMTALHFAIHKGCKEVVEVLLRCGANFGRGSFFTPLHIAAQRGFLDIVDIVLKFDTDIDARDGYGRTPLHLACSGGRIPVIVALLKHGSDINIKCRENRLSIDYAITLDDYDPDDDDDPREIVKDTLRYHIVKLKTANLYVNEENLKFLTSNNEINDIQYKCNEEIARMKSEKINNANVSFFDILTKGPSRIALYAENEDIVQALQSDDYKIKFSIYGDMIENNFRKGKRRKALLKEGNKCFNILFNNVHELPYTCTRKIFSYLSDNDLKILTHPAFERRKGLLEQGYRFFHFLFMSLPDFPYKCTEKIFSYLSDEDLRILVEACKPANVSLQY